jgi:hypothetical protein
MADTYLTGGVWSFDNAAFTDEMVGGLLTIAGSPEATLNGAFEITAVNSPTQVAMTPVPVFVDPALVFATSISLTYIPAPLVTAGAQIVGVSLIPIAKDGMDKLGSNKRAT